MNQVIASQRWNHEGYPVVDTYPDTDGRPRMCAACARRSREVEPCERRAMGGVVDIAECDGPCDYERVEHRNAGVTDTEHPRLRASWWAAHGERATWARAYDVARGIRIHAGTSESIEVSYRGARSTLTLTELEAAGEPDDATGRAYRLVLRAAQKRGWLKP